MTIPRPRGGPFCSSRCLLTTLVPTWPVGLPIDYAGAEARELRCRSPLVAPYTSRLRRAALLCTAAPANDAVIRDAADTNPLPSTHHHSALETLATPRTRLATILDGP